ncbi:MAG: hypothetical protein ACHQQ3_05085 [Gemmatimonadales bacterium]
MHGPRAAPGVFASLTARSVAGLVDVALLAALAGPSRSASGHRFQS